MSLMETLRVALEALNANKMRSILTMLGIIIGVGSVVAIFAIGEGAEKAVKGQFEGSFAGLFILHPGSIGPGGMTERQEPFTENDIRSIERLLPDVDAAITTRSLAGQAKYEREAASVVIEGTYHNGTDFASVKVAQGRWFTRAEQEAGARVAVLGTAGVKKLMGEGVNPIGRTITLNGYPFEVIGVAESVGLLASLGGGESRYFVPVTWVERVTGNQPIWDVWVKVKPGANSEQVMKDAIAVVQRNHNGAKYWGENLDQITQFIGGVMTVVTGVMSAVAAISLLVGGVGIMNIMLVSVTERTREIGIRKAIGASFKDILVQFLIEAVLLCLIGGGVGVLLAAIPTWLIGRSFNVEMLISFKHVAIALGFSAFVGVVFGVYPASKAARMDPIEALRYE